MRRDTPALFRRSAITRHRSATQRAGAVLLWVISVSGAVLWGGGGWSQWAAYTPNVATALLALVVQLLTSWAQLTASDRRLSIQYLAALTVSSGTTLAGYVPLVNLGLADWFGVQVWTPWWWLAIMIVVVAAVAVDVVPERTLFED
jgi:hypothetical protein